MEVLPPGNSRDFCTLTSVCLTELCVVWLLVETHNAHSNAKRDEDHNLCCYSIPVSRDSGKRLKHCSLGRVLKACCRPSRPSPRPPRASGNHLLSIPLHNSTTNPAHICCLLRRRISRYRITWYDKDCAQRCRPLHFDAEQSAQTHRPIRRAPPPAPRNKMTMGRS